MTKNSQIGRLHQKLQKIHKSLKNNKLIRNNIFGTSFVINVANIIKINKKYIRRFHHDSIKI